MMIGPFENKQTFKVLDTTEHVSTRCKGWCARCQHVLVWCNKNGKRGGRDRVECPRIRCPQCMHFLTAPNVAPKAAPTYSLDRVMFEGKDTTWIYTPWGGYGEYGPQTNIPDCPAGI